MVERTQTGGWMPSIYEPIRTVGKKVADWFAPRSDASAMTAAYVITMELPGVDPENVEIAVQDAALVVTGEKQSEQEETTKNYFFSEREYGMFQRAFRIPPDADADSIDATFRQGVLTIRLPKLRVAGEGRKVPIRSE